MERPAHPLVVPDIGASNGTIVMSLWLVPEGAAVIEGDRVAELAWGGATLDLEAPVTGRLVRQLVDEDARVAVGMTIAEFTPLEAEREGPR
jgi:pyruvate/2-oxoglutarate dehydrogenase complex dihydrolipoamide acyltransferase (E2) component